MQPTVQLHETATREASADGNKSRTEQQAAVEPKVGAPSIPEQKIDNLGNSQKENQEQESAVESSVGESHVPEQMIDNLGNSPKENQVKCNAIEEKKAEEESNILQRRNMETIRAANYASNQDFCRNRVQQTLCFNFPRMV